MNTSLRISTEGDEFLSSDSEVSESLGHQSSTSDGNNISLEPDMANMLKKQKQVHRLQKMLDREKGSRNDLQNKNNSLLEDVKIQKEKIEILSKERMLLEKTRIETEAEIKKLRINLMDETEKRQNLERLLAISREQLTQLSESFKKQFKFESTLEDGHSDIVNMTETNRLLQNVKESVDYFELLGREPPMPSLERRRSSISLSHLEKQQLEIKAEFAEEKLGFEKKISHLSIENNSLHKQIEKLTNDLKLDDKTMEDTFAQHIVELEKLTLENQRLNQLSNDLNIELKDKCLQFDNMEDEFKNASKIMQSNVDLLKLDVDALNHQAEMDRLKYQEEISLLKKELKENMDMINILKRDIEERDIEIKRLLSELSLRDDSIRIIQITADRTNDDNLSAKSEIESFKHKLTLMETNNLELQKRFESEEKQVVRLQQVSERLKDDLKKSSQEITRLLEDKSEIKTQNNLKENELGQLRFENKQMLRDLKNIADNLTEKDQQLSIIKQAADNYKNMCGEAESKAASAQMQLTLELEQFEKFKLGQEETLQQLNDKINKLENSKEHLQVLLDDKDSNYADALIKFQENNAKLKSVVDENQENCDKSKNRRMSSSNEISEKYNKNKRPTKFHHRRPPVQPKFNYDSELSRLKLEMEARVQLQLNSKLNAINDYLTEHSSACDEMLRMREENEAALRRQLALSQMNVKNQFIKFQHQDGSQLNNFNRTNNAVNLKNQNSEVHKMQDANESMRTILNKINNMSTSTSYRYEVGDNRKIVDFNLQEELNRSIAKHLEKEPLTKLTPIIRTDPDLLEGKSRIMHSMASYM